MSSMYPPYGSGVAGQVCQRCGMPLPPNEMYCSNCGHYNAQAGGFQGGPPSQGPVSNPWGAGTPPYPSTAYGQNSYPGVSSPQWGQPASGPSSSPSYGGIATPPHGAGPGDYYGAQAPAPYPPGGLQPGGYAPPSPSGGFAPPTPPRGRPRTGLLVLMIVLVLVVVAGGVGALALVRGNSKSTTPTVVPRTSSQATTSPATPPLFSDTFANNNQGWDLTSVPGRYSVKLGNGQLLLEEDNNHILPEFVPGKTFDNFRLDVDVAITKGTQDNSGFGVYIRGASNQNTELATFYRFAMYGDSTYAIFKGMVDASGQPQNDQKLVGYLPTSALKPIGQVNHVEILARGATMTLTVNGQTLNTVTDNSYKSGTIALYVSNLPDTPKGVVVAFSNLVIYPVS
jgi:hypothetical protein